MKYFLIIVIGLIISGCSTKSTDESEIRKTIENYLECTKKEDFECLYSLTHPRSFESFTKQQVITDVQQGMHNENYDIIVKSSFLDSISTVIPFNENKYAMVKTKSNIIWVSKQASNPNETLVQMCSVFSDMYGKQNIKCNTVKNQIDIRSNETSYLIYEAKDKKWYVLSGSIEKNVVRLIPRTIKQNLQKLHKPSIE